MSSLEQLNSIIDIDKEIIETLPQNNKKNINIYLKKVTELKEKYLKLETDIIKEINRRYKQISGIKPNQEILSMQDVIKTNESIQYLLNDIDTSYEKMDLDKGLVILEQYQRKNLEIINDNIAFCIDKFKQVGIDLEQQDFDYSHFVKQYLSVFFDEMEEGTIDSALIKNKFDELYWKCPGLIMQIVLNFKHLYLMNENKINKYYIEQKRKLLKNHDEREIKRRFFDLQKQLDKELELDSYTVLIKLLNNELNLKDFGEKQVRQRYEMFISPERLDFTNEEAMDEIDFNLKKLLNSLIEYKYYLKFKFIIDGIKEIYEKNAKTKSQFEKIKRQIFMKERNRAKMNAKIDKQVAAGRTSKSLIAKRDLLLDSLIDLYQQLDENKVYDKITKELNENSSLLDIINLAGSFYEFLYSFIQNAKKDIEDDEIDTIINDINEFRKFPYSTIMRNITMSYDKDIALMIKEMYQLLGINIEAELDQDSIDGLIENINKILIYRNIRKNKIDLSVVESACEFKTILKNYMEQKNK